MLSIKKCVIIYCLLFSSFAKSYEESTIKIDRDVFSELQEYKNKWSTINKDVCNSISEVTLYKLSGKNKKWEQVKVNDSNHFLTLITTTLEALISEDIPSINDVVSIKYKENTEEFNKAITPYFEQLKVIKIKEVLGYIKYGKHLIYILNMEYKRPYHGVRFHFLLDSESNYKFEPEGPFNKCVDSIITGYIGELNT